MRPSTCAWDRSQAGQLRPDIFIAGFCLCGHHWSEHHDNRAECEFYGSNEDGGLDETGERHCFRYVDKEQADEWLLREWHQRLGSKSSGQNPRG
jgi:hypothetical protein